MNLFKSINHYRADPMGWIGSVVMLGFAGYALWRWHLSGFIFFLLLVLRDIVAAWFLLTRNSSSIKKTNHFIEILAYVSSGWAFLYLSADERTASASLIASCLSIAGFTLSTLALFDLGKSFGISPANRGVVHTGVYRYLKHPMYVGYVISEAGFIVLNPWNGLFWAISVSFYFWRAKIEATYFLNSQPAERSSNG